MHERQSDVAQVNVTITWKQAHITGMLQIIAWIIQFFSVSF